MRSNSLGLTIMRGKAGAWTPAALAPHAWYEPGPAYCFTDAGGTTPCGDGDSVYTWKDRSGNARHLVQSSAAKRPTLRLVSGKWRVRTDGTNDDMLTSTFALANPITAITRVAFLNAAPAGFEALYSSNDSSRVVLRLSGSSRTYLSNGATLEGSYTPLTNAPFTQLSYFDAGASSSITVDGGTPTVGNAGTGTGTRHYLATNGGNYHWANADYTALIVVPRAVTAGEQASLLQYLNQL